MGGILRRRIGGRPVAKRRGAACALGVLVFVLTASPHGAAADWASATLFNGERTGVLGESTFLNHWGGVFNKGSLPTLARDTTVFRSGAASVRADLGTINPGGSGFFQTFSSSITGGPFRQTRDLTRYDSFEGYVRNETGAPLNLRYEIKDYQDNNAIRASYTFAIPADSAWTKVTAPLDTSAPGWVVEGNPDLSRTYITSFVFSPQAGAATGSVYIDDFSLHEEAGGIDPATAPIGVLAARLAERQFSGLWTARNRTSGLIHNTSDNSNTAAMNTTGGVLWMLPSAVRRGWVSQADADDMAARVVTSLNTNLNASNFVPTRFVNSLTAARPGGSNEESSIDASFMLLALQNYKAQPTTSPALAASLDLVANRFQLDSFVSGGRFKLAYFPSSGFTSGTYDGYTNEGKVISLAAETLVANNVPLETTWNADTARTRTSLVNADDAHLVHTQPQYRAPFEQALINLFVDTSDRGVDNFSVRALATNPWENYVRYERETAAKLDQLGRDAFFQPDAGNGGTGGYQQYSMYNNFGQSTLFMPWSATLALLAGAPGAEDALRALLGTDLLNGPLGLADSARWATGAAGPTNVPGQQDNWNMVLSTMALLEYLDGDDSASRFFASLPQISAALDNVFVDGDVSGDGLVNLVDYNAIASNFGDLAGATPASGDADGDGAVDGADLIRWQRGLDLSPTAAIPEPPGGLLAAGLFAGIGLFNRLNSRGSSRGEQFLGVGRVRA